VVDEARKLKKELLLFKVDFEKAYDSVDWGILMRLWVVCLFRPCGENGLKSVLVPLLRQC